MPTLVKLLSSQRVIWTLLVLPGLWPLWPIFISQNPSVTADPFKYVLHHLGFVACIVLAVVLSFSPLRVLWPQWGVAQALNRHRRLVGVAACVYAALHLCTHSAGAGGHEPALRDSVARWQAVEKHPPARLRRRRPRRVSPSCGEETFPTASRVDLRPVGDSGNRTTVETAAPETGRRRDHPIRCGTKRLRLPVMRRVSSRRPRPQASWFTIHTPHTGRWPEKFGIAARAW